jgi:2-oxoglutarate ferredoxin oxidoreductase subunit beta
MRVAELLAVLPGSAYVTRQSVLDPAGIRKTKKAIRTALQAQQLGLGFALVEILSTCPTNWHLGPEQSLEWAKAQMVPYYPLGDTKVSDAVRELMQAKPDKAI